MFELFPEGQWEKWEKWEGFNYVLVLFFPGGRALIPGVIQHGSVLLVRLCLWLARRSRVRYGLRPRAYFPTHPHADQDQDTQLEYERDLAR